MRQPFEVSFPSTNLEIKIVLPMPLTKVGLRSGCRSARILMRKPTKSQHSDHQHKMNLSMFRHVRQWHSDHGSYALQWHFTIATIDCIHIATGRPSNDSIAGQLPSITGA